MDHPQEVEIFGEAGHIDALVAGLPTVVYEHPRGFGEGAIQALWDILLPFSDYAFNKAHGIVPRTVIKSVRELLEISATAEDVNISPMRIAEFVESQKEKQEKVL